MSLKDTILPKHIFGMAKSCLNLNGAKEQKMRLDLLQLIYTIDRLTRKGEECHGCLMITTGEIEKSANFRKNKYEFSTPNIEIVSLSSLGIKIEDDLLNEKENNAMHIDAIARIGREFMEKQLENYLNKKFGLMEQGRDKEFMGIKWDYYACQF